MSKDLIRDNIKAKLIGKSPIPAEFAIEANYKTIGELDTYDKYTFHVHIGVQLSGPSEEVETLTDRAAKMLTNHIYSDVHVELLKLEALLFKKMWLRSDDLIVKQLAKIISMTRA